MGSLDPYKVGEEPESSELEPSKGFALQENDGLEKHTSW